jgi:DNA-binding transcriptional ArsR family regulator
MATKVNPLSPKAQEILDFLKGQVGAITLADIKANIEGANSAHLTALRSRGLIDATETEKEVVRVVKSKVLTYAVKGE